MSCNPGQVTFAQSFGDTEIQSLFPGTSTKICLVKTAFSNYSHRPILKVSLTLFVETRTPGKESGTERNPEFDSIE